MRVPLQVAAGLRERGHIAETWFLYLGNWAYENEKCIRVIFPRKVRGIIDIVRIFLRLFFAMRAFRPDAVHGVLPLGNVLGLIAATMIGCPSRVASQHVPPDTYKPIMRRLDMIVGSLNFYTANITVSKAVEGSFSRYPKCYRRKLITVYNGVRVERPSCTKAEARRRFGLPDRPFILGSVGRLAEQKNPGLLLQLLGSCPGAHLALAGDGPLREQLQDIVSKQSLSGRVTFLGSIREAEVRDFLEAIDLFVLPSRFEGHPISLLEAMAAGMPIIASDIPSVREAAGEGSDGPAVVTVPLDEPEAWVSQIERIMKEPGLRRDLADTARERVKDFSVEKMIDEYESFLLLDPDLEQTA